jgi:Na+-transporting methylmalonyl-CoA/oxaloacetate decarboxylase gamma subunit
MTRQFVEGLAVGMGFVLVFWLLFAVVVVVMEGV